jgi:hypothetical protein
MRISSQKLKQIAGRKYGGVPFERLNLYVGHKGKVFLLEWNSSESPTQNNLARLLGNGNEMITSRDLGIS